MVLAAVVAAVLIFYRPAFEVTAITAPADVVAGDDVVLTVDVGNDGLRGGELELTVLVGDRPEQTVIAEVAAGAQERVRIVLRDLPAGTHRLTLADWDEPAASVWVMTPAEIVVDYLVVEPSPIDVRSQTEATVLVGLSNLGEAPGSHAIDLLLDGEHADGRGIDLTGGEVVEESFTITVDSPGDHEVSVGDVTQAFRAHTLHRPDNGEQLVNTIGGGSNQLEITNNDDRDVLIVLAGPDDDDALLSVYVRAGSSTTVTRLRNGSYRAYYMHGTGWCTHFKQFTRQASAGRFDGTADFESTATHYTVYTLEMGVSGEDSSPTQYLDLDDVPSF